MLVLSRKAGERIHIGEDVVITLTKVANNRVAIGIEAPKDIAVRRGELEDALNGGSSKITFPLRLHTAK